LLNIYSGVFCEVTLGVDLPSRGGSSLACIKSSNGEQHMMLFGGFNGLEFFDNITSIPFADLNRKDP
jgi:hypothetical protein